MRAFWWNVMSHRRRGISPCPPLPFHWLAVPLEQGLISLTAQVGMASVRLNRNLTQDDIFFIPAYMPSRWRYQASRGCLHLFLSDGLLLAALTACGFPETRLSDLFPLLGESVPQVARTLRKLAVGAHQPLDGGEVFEIVKDLVLHCLGPEKERNERRLSKAAFSRVSALVHAQFQGGVTLAKMAEVAAMSPGTLSRKFKLGIGRGPSEYTNWVRACQVRAWLHERPEERMSMAEMAQQTGFTDQPHMIRTFSKLLGRTPGEYAKELGLDKKKTTGKAAGKKAHAGGEPMA